MPEPIRELNASELLDLMREHAQSDQYEDYFLVTPDNHRKFHLVMNDVWVCRDHVVDDSEWMLVPEFCALLLAHPTGWKLYDQDPYPYPED